MTTCKRCGGPQPHVLPDARCRPCIHANALPGPRIALRYGSATSEVCQDCGAWRATHHMAGSLGQSRLWHESALTVDDVSAPCEWSPQSGRAVHGGEPYHAEAVICLGRNPSWHLCAACSALPEFKRYRKRVAIGAVRKEAP